MMSELPCVWGFACGREYAVYDISEWTHPTLFLQTAISDAGFLIHYQHHLQHLKKFKQIPDCQVTSHESSLSFSIWKSNSSIGHYATIQCTCGNKVKEGIDNTLKFVQERVWGAAGMYFLILLFNFFKLFLSSCKLCVPYYHALYPQTLA